jgi:hypothetical protein
VNRRTVLFIFCVTILAGLLTLEVVDPAIALSPDYPALRGCWAYLEIVLLGAGIVTVWVGYLALRLWIKDRRSIDATVSLIVVVVLSIGVFFARERFIDHYGVAADEILAVAKTRSSNDTFGGDATKIRGDLMHALAAEESAIRRIRTLPRYSLYEYEVRSKQIAEPFFVSMSLEHGGPKLAIRLRSDLVPRFPE